MEAMHEPQADLAQVKRCGSDGALPTSNAGGCFDCNICLEFAVEPVVTLCGHLYCWPCIYKWLQQGDSISPQQCPVCKALLANDALVPLYGRGNSTKRSLQILKDIPHRPPSVHRDYAGSGPGSPRLNVEHHDPEPPVLQHRQQHYHLDGPYYGYPYSNQISSPSSPLRTPTGNRMIHSTAGGILGGMAIAVLPWVSRNQAGMYYPNPYHLGSGLTPPLRLRRHEMQVVRSLHQIWAFLFCCVLLCLLLF